VQQPQNIASILLILICNTLFFTCFIFDSPFGSNSNKKNNANHYKLQRGINKNYNIPAKVVEIPLPSGFIRKKVSSNSFAAYLRNLGLKKPGVSVMLYNGKRKGNQYAHYRVIDMDIGKKNLQQCADSIMRLRAEYLFSQRRFNSIKFNFTSGQNIPFSKWAKGYYPMVKGSSVKWIKKTSLNYSYTNLRKYLEIIFIYAGTASLSKELKPVSGIKYIRIGDIFIQGGFPGHAVIVVDIASNIKNNNKIFLLAQSFMPAQEIHILKNPNSSGLNPWYSINFGKKLVTPEWNFTNKDLKRF
jgi:hypothetical protein